MITSLKFLLFIFFITYSINSYSQNIEVKGTVKEENQQVLPYTNVIAKPFDTTYDMYFAITDEKGRYSLKLKKNLKYSISISYIGFETIEKKIIASNNMKLNFILKESTNLLDEVVIELPVTVKEDTIAYRVDKFTNGKERKLKHILKKLPGVEVSSKGKVTVMGKTVTKLLVDNKPFFGGNTKLGIENIPADAIENIKAIDNYNPVAFLKKVSDSDVMALNVSLKEDKKTIIFGDIEAGKGNSSYYKAHANLFYYTPKINLNFIGNTNNFGEVTMSFDDYISFSGGLNTVFKGDFDYKGGNFKDFLNDSDILKTKRIFGAANILQELSEKLRISGYAVVSNTQKNSYIIENNTYNFLKEDKENTKNQNQFLGILNTKLDYSPDINQQWFFNTEAKKANTSADDFIRSTINNQTNTIETNKIVENNYINQTIEWHQRKSNKHTFSALTNYKFDQNTPTTTWETTNPILQNLIPIDISQNKFNIKQLKKIQKHYLHSFIKHYWVINSVNHIYSTLGNTYKQESFFTKDFQVLDNNKNNYFTNYNFDNKINYRLNDFSFSLFHKFNTGILTSEYGASLHNYSWNIQQFQTQNTHNSKWLLLPKIKTELKFSNSKKLKIKYALKAKFLDASRVAEHFYLNSYSSIFKGSSTFSNELRHDFSLFYTRFSLYRRLMFVASAAYYKKVRGYQNIVNFEKGNRYLTYQIFNNPNQNFMLNTTLQKSIKKLKCELKIGYRLAEMLQKINKKTITNTNNKYIFNLNFKTLYKKFPNFRIGYKYNIGNYKSNGILSKFSTAVPFINVEYDFVENFNFNFEYSKSYYNNKNFNLTNSYEVANAFLMYKIDDTPITFKLIAKNLFNTKFNQTNSFTNYLVTDQKSYILPRVIVLSAIYKL